jgi:GAF domain-containing protein
MRSGFTTSHVGRCHLETPPVMAEFAAAVLDLAGRVTHWGWAAQRLFGRSPEQAIGRGICDLLLRGAHRDTVTRALAEVAEGRCWSGLLAAECADGHVRDLTFCWEPLAGTGPGGPVLVSFRTLQPHGDEIETDTACEHLALTHEMSMRICASLDLSQTAQDFTHVTMPRIADIVSINVLEHLLRDGGLPELAADGSIEVRRLALGLAITQTDAQDWAAAFPADEIVVCRAMSPAVRCMASGRPTPFTAAELEPQSLDRIRNVLDDDEFMCLLDDTSFLALPLKARDMVLGFVVFGRKADRPPFRKHGLALAEGLTAQAAICIDNARLYGREHHIAQALLENLAPKDLAIPPGLDVAHRYLPASRMTPVGGDWYDVIPLSETLVAFVIGDAMGHGAVAGAAMGRLRTATRALASLDLPPAEVLRRLDQITCDTDPGQCATCVYAVYDLGTRTCSLARAGHVPPVLSHSDGSTTVLDLPPGLPLGLGSTVFETTELEIPEGDTLVLYTDGLVESREQDIDTGITTLRTALAHPHDSLDATCDAIITTLSRQYDDVALLLIRHHTQRPFTGPSPVRRGA